MRTFTTTIKQNRQSQSSNVQRFTKALAVSITEVLALFAAAISAIGIVLLAVWASGLESMAILSAITWATSFIFLAMAVDNNHSTALLQAFTGIALMILSWLQNSVSPEFTIVTGVLIAAWVSISLYWRLKKNQDTNFFLL